MDVREAVATRRSVRAFLPAPVERETIERVLDRARYAPSAGNLQPWHAVVLTGEPLQKLFEAVAADIAAGSLVEESSSYPDPLPDPYMARRRQCGFDMYAAVGIERHDRAARNAQSARNFIAFDAPCLLLCHMPRIMGEHQWADLGIWLQTVMLLFQEEGIDTCPQAAWSYAGSGVRKGIHIPDDHIIYCGIAIGIADPTAPINEYRTKRAPLSESVEWVGF